MDCGLWWCNFFTLVVFSADLEIVCSGLSSHHHFVYAQNFHLGDLCKWWVSLILTYTVCYKHSVMLGWVWFITCWSSVPVKVHDTETCLLHAVRVASNKKCSKPKHICTCNLLYHTHFPCLAFLYKVTLHSTLHSNIKQLWLMSHKLMSQYRINIPISVNEFSTSLDYVIVV